MNLNDLKNIFSLQEKFIVPNVGIGTKAPAYKLDVRGGQVAGAGVFVNTSDVRTKKDIEPIAYGLDAVLKLRPVGFNWKDQSQEWAKQHQIGLIAQEAELVIPERSVSTANDPDQMKSIAYGAITPVLIRATQELHGLCKMSQEQLASIQIQIDDMDAAWLLLKNQTRRKSVRFKISRRKQHASKLRKNAKTARFKIYVSAWSA